MFTQGVRSDTKPKEFEYFKPADVAEVYIRESIKEVEETTEGGEAGTYTAYEYDETYFQTTESEADIKVNLDVWKEYGAAWEAQKILTQKEIISALQTASERARADIDYLAAMVDVDLEA